MTPVAISPEAPDADILAVAATRIIGGGVVVFPTQSLYGLGANALDAAAVDKVFRIKARPPEKPVLVLIDGITDLDRLVARVPESARRIISLLWPGNVTLVFRARAGVPANLTAGTGKIGVRLPLHPVARSLVKCAGLPITGTSANLSGRPGCANVSDIDPWVLDRSDMVLDAGPLKGGTGSTIVDVTHAPPRILREGSVGAAVIDSALCQKDNLRWPPDGLNTCREET